MVLSTETFNQSVPTEYSEAVNARYAFQLLWVSDKIKYRIRQRLYAAFKLTPPPDFVKTWGHKHLLCRVDNKTLSVLIQFTFIPYFSLNVEKYSIVVLLLSRLRKLF